jgi:O-antigen ligase
VVIPTTVNLLLFILIAQGIQSFRALQGTALVILAISLFLGVVVFMQARNPLECILLNASTPGDTSGRSDGRPCEAASECRDEEEPGEDYLCERPGPFHTTSVAHGRVRYLGILEDPNELSMALALALPFAMAFVSMRRSVARLLLLAASFAIALPVIIWTESRTGQLVFLAVVVVYLVERPSWKSLLIAATLAAPALLLGGRSGSDAESSSLERLEAWSAGMQMFRSSPLWGIGNSDFVEHFYITAHNTFVLAAAELGFVGLVLWTSVLYTDFKIVVTAMRRYQGHPEASVAYLWARALLASLCGIAVGATFLSLAYHPVVWAFMALPGAYYLAARNHDPEFRVTFGVRDLLAVTGGAILWLAILQGYLRARGLQ